MTFLIRKVKTFFRIIRTEGISGLITHLRQKYPSIFPSPKYRICTSSEHDKWLLAQKHELDFHCRSKFRQSGSFATSNAEMFRNFGFKASDYEGEVVLDLGAGSKLRSNFFKEAIIVALEPLADKFRNEIDWCDLESAWKVFSVPAEHSVEELHGKISLIISINVLDHCEDLSPILDNIVSYLKEDGVAFLSFDSHDFPEPCHPLVLNDTICSDLFKKHGLNIVKKTQGLGERSGYSGDSQALNYWCKLSTEGHI